ncbi:PiggyBac transposable element-derived protein 2 [Plakobranchus ocellatus]|uniref:PiggyBac transposable element-derived protein 2 n=1 Tax=Plakobranchus ocellatus TaxID=259542 RepID=A0AAV4CVZ8_9GAST|nr:PiggyBac transposable element-derived protein 2 [Plakobranchus ocellatus]
MIKVDKRVPLLLGHNELVQRAEGCYCGTADPVTAVPVIAVPGTADPVAALLSLLSLEVLLLVSSWDTGSSMSVRSPLTLQRVNVDGSRGVTVGVQGVNIEKRGSGMEGMNVEESESILERVEDMNVDQSGVARETVEGLTIEESGIACGSVQGLNVEQSGIAHETVEGLIIEESGVARETVEGLTIEESGVARETVEGLTIEESWVAPGSVQGLNVEQSGIAPESQTCQAKIFENRSGPSIDGIRHAAHDLSERAVPQAKICPSIGHRTTSQHNTSQPIMDSSDEDTLIMLIMLNNRKKKRKRRIMWCRETLLFNGRGEFHRTFNSLMTHRDETLFFNYIRMSYRMYEELKNLRSKLSDCISDDDSEYLPSSSDSGDEVQPSPRKKKRVSIKNKSIEKLGARPSCSRSLDKEDSDPEDHIPLAHLQQKMKDRLSPEASDGQVTEEELLQMLDALMWSKINFQVLDSTFKGQEEQAPEKLKEPLEYFRDFVTNEMIESIAQQTNAYSVQKEGKSIGTSKNEIDLFIRLFLRMGLVQAYSLRAFWAEETRYDKIADNMARNRFEKLASHIHFTDNNKVTDEQKKNKVWQIEPWLKGLKNSLAKLPQEEFSAVNEIMIPFKGRSDIKQFMRNKPHKWGFKMWGRAGASGLLYEFDVYQGASENTCIDGSPELSKSSQVVIRMTSNVPLGQNFKVFADNFFTSLNLVKTLQSKGIFYVGTIRVNRLKGLELKTENELKVVGRGAYDHAVEVNSGCVAVRWRDNRTVDLLSSYVGLEPISEVQRYDKKEKVIIKVPCPATVKEYKKFMGSIDLHDMLTALYRFPLRAKRWYVYMFYYTIHMMVVNAWLRYRKHAKLLQVKTTMRLAVFQGRLATQLVLSKKAVGQSRGTSVSPKPTPSCSGPYRRKIPPLEIRLDGLNHFPEYSGDRGRCKHNDCDSLTYIKENKLNISRLQTSISRKIGISQFKSGNWERSIFFLKIWRLPIKSGDLACLGFVQGLDVDESGIDPGSVQCLYIEESEVALGSVQGPNIEKTRSIVEEDQDIHAEVSEGVSKVAQDVNIGETVTEGVDEMIEGVNVESRNLVGREISEVPDVSKIAGLHVNREKEGRVGSCSSSQSCTGTTFTKKEEQKRRKQFGKAYIGRCFDKDAKKFVEVDKEEKTLGPGCACKDLYYSCKSVSDSDREEVWSMSWDEKKVSVRMAIDVKDVKERKSVSHVHKRNNILVFNLKSEGTCMRVCKDMFLNTTGLKKWWVLNTVTKGVPSNPKKHKVHVKSQMV